MSELFYTWLAIGVVALIVEAVTTAFFALAFALSAFIIAAYVAFSGETAFTLPQAAIFVVTGAVFAFFFPKWFNRRGGGYKQGLDSAVGKTYHLKRVADDWKVAIDGVDYLVDEDCVTEAFAIGVKVRVESHASGSVTVVPVSK